jgi:hypothetical protein
VYALDQIPWNDVYASLWGGDREKIRRKQAEALVPSAIAPSHFQCLHVRKLELRERAAAIVHEAALSLSIRVTPGYYFLDTDRPPVGRTSDPYGEIPPNPEWEAWADYFDDRDSDLDDVPF